MQKTELKIILLNGSNFYRTFSHKGRGVYRLHTVLDDIPTAVTWAKGIFKHCEQLSIQPESGRKVPESLTEQK